MSILSASPASVSIPTERIPCGTRRVPIRLSIETPSGKHRRLSVTIERTPTDSDAVVMHKASTAYRQRHGFSSRIVAIYVTGS